MLPEEIRNLIITGLAKYTDMLEDFEYIGLDFQNAQHLVPAALKKLQVTLPGDLLNKILPTDFIEIYSPELVPMFKTPNFWGTSSYPLDELYSFPYDELYERSEFYQASINRSVKKIFSGQSILLENPVPAHVAWEKRGQKKSCEMVIKYLAAVFDGDGNTVGAICISQITPHMNA